MALPALLALGNAAFQFWQGQNQKDMASKVKSSNYIPPALREAEQTARQQAASSVMPGYARGLDRLKTVSANTNYRTERSTNNAGVIQSTLADTDAREKEVIKDMTVSNEAFKADNRSKLMGILGQEGQYQKSAFDSANATKSALLGAGMQNEYNALSGLAAEAIVSPDQFKFKIPKIDFARLFRKKSDSFNISDAISTATNLGMGEFSKGPARFGTI